jgi:hypothetical protein
MRTIALASLAAAALAGCVIVPVDPGPPYAAVAPAVVVRPGPILLRPHHRHYHDGHFDRGHGDRYRPYRY